MNRLPSLNGLRALSIIIVILYHYVHFNIPVPAGDIFLVPFINGQFGVNVFFVISGFLITYLLLKEEEKAGSISIKNFYIRRVLRIFPAYYFLLFVYFILQLLGYLHIPGTAWLTALTYTKYLSPREEIYTAHAWSLSIEETFYLFWPTIFVLRDKVRKRAALSLVCIIPLVRVFVFFYPVSWINDLSVFTRIDAIATGCCIALYRTEILTKISRYWNELVIGSVFVLFLTPWIAQLFNGTYLILIFVAFGTLSGTIANGAIGIIMLYSVYGPRTYWYKLLNSKPFNYIGILSYSLYLWQQFFILKRSWWVTHAPQNIILIFLAAMFSYYIIERPFLRIKTKYSRKKLQTQPTQELNTQTTPPPHSTSLSPSQ